LILHHRPLPREDAGAEPGYRGAHPQPAAAALDLDARQTPRRPMATGRDAVSTQPIKPASTAEFGSAALAREYVAAVRREIAALDPQGLIAVINRLQQAYRAFPELELEHPRGALSGALLAAAKKVPDPLAVPLLLRLVAFDRSCLSSVTLLCDKIIAAEPQSLSRILQSSALPPQAVASIAAHLCRRDLDPAKLQIFAEIFGFAAASDGASRFTDTLLHSLPGGNPSAIDSLALVKAAAATGQGSSAWPLGRTGSAMRDALLAMARRLAATLSLPQPSLHPHCGWPSARLSFDEFLLQWPCEIALPVDQDDAVFIDEAYRAILLRPPEAAEFDQCLKLLRDGVVGRAWIIEHLLASGELHLLERRLRVRWGGHVITEPERPDVAVMPAVSWPRR
jgi:hypothetical protein